MKRIVVMAAASAIVASAGVVALSRGDRPADVESVAAEQTPFDASSDPIISKNPKILLVEGIVLTKEVRNTKNHPGLRFSENAAEAAEQRAFAAKNHFQAEITVDVDRWVSGNGPKQIVVTKSVSFEELDEVPGPHVAFSGAWDKAQYEAVEVGSRYRLYVDPHPFFESKFHRLASDPKALES